MLQKKMETRQERAKGWGEKMKRQRDRLKTNLRYIRKKIQYESKRNLKFSLVMVCSAPVSDV